MLSVLSARARLHARALRDGTRPIDIQGLAPGGTVSVRRGRSLLTAVLVDTFDAWALRDRCRDVTVEALTRAGIEHRVLPALGAEPHRVVVSSSDAEATQSILVALNDIDPDLHLHTGLHASGRLGPSRPARSLPALRAGSVVRVWSPQVSPAGRMLPTRSLGVDVEVWTELAATQASPDGPERPTGTLVAPRPNPFVRSIPPGTLAASLDPPTGTPLEQVDFPIDVVYTWVDSADPAWQEDYAAARAGTDTSAGHASAWSTARWTNRDELRYSLRSIAAYASWVRTIHIVTNGQVPGWLDTDHPKVRVVRHDEIFADTADLPTFSSHAIEANLHRVPGLAQHYLYLNDDVFLARPLRPEHFFTGSGLVRWFPSHVPVDDGPARADDLPVVQAMKNGRALLDEHLGRRPTTRPRHTPHPQRRDVLEDIEAACPDAVRRTSRARFRSPTDISLASQLQAWWADATGRAVPSDTTYEFIDIGDPGVDARIERMLVRADLDSFCLNETTDTDPEVAAKRLRGVLEALLPCPSPFEIPDPSPDTDG
ncbi:stealth family protein [Marihabitans asiaticum]|uniref:Stealth-like protein n=1 Tax=Marihabitans asiaticum TaxID=415218 RepID=A0A560WHC3_9MICO|nr:stealth family protein [Marihabitans asiaticum]TWD16956.1 Stealth-like protein [Marihabitans asiaticum]